MLYRLARSTCFAQKGFYALLCLPHIVVILSLLLQAFLKREQLSFLLVFDDCVTVNPTTQIKLVKKK